MPRVLELSNEMRLGVELLLECSATCTETMIYCLQHGSRMTETDHIRLLADCAEICHTTGNILMRGGDYSTGVCAPCSEICDRCAVSCEQYSHDDRMQQCAEICRSCADICLALIPEPLIEEELDFEAMDEEDFEEDETED
jgi:hypothetical protein